MAGEEESDTGARSARATQYEALLEADDLLTLRQQRLSIEPDLTIEVRRLWQLKAASLPDALTALGPNDIILFPMRVPEVGSRRDASVTVHSLEGERRGRVVDNSVLGWNLSSNPSPSGALPLTIDLLRREVDECSTIDLVVAQPGRSPVGRRFRPRQLLPVSAFEIDFPGGTSVTPLAIDFPGTASADVVVLNCELDMTTTRNALKTYREHWLSADEDPAAAGRLFCTEVTTLASSVRDDCNRILDCHTKDYVKKAAGRRWGLAVTKVPRRWTNDIVKLKESVTSVHDDSASLEDPTVHDVVRMTERLLTAVKPAIAFSVLGSITTEGVARLPPLISNRWDLFTRRVRFEHVVVPITTENEPGSQGKRSALIVFILSVLLLALSLFDRSWLPTWLPNRLGLNRSEKPLGKPELDLVLDALVAILLIFPAILYSQYFQTRPRSNLGNRAQSGTFALVSLAFTLPLVPAILLVLGSPTRNIAVVMFFFGAIVCFASFLVLGVFSAANLKRMRVTEGLKAGSAYVRRARKAR